MSWGFTGKFDYLLEIPGGADDDQRSPPNRARLRFNQNTTELEISRSGADYGPVGMDEASHRDLYTLVHQETRSGYDEIIYDAEGRIISCITWTDISRSQRIADDNIIYNDDLIEQVTSRQYDNDGVLKEQVTETIIYDGDERIVGITRNREL